MSESWRLFSTITKAVVLLAWAWLAFLMGDNLALSPLDGGLRRNDNLGKGSVTRPGYFFRAAARAPRNAASFSRSLISSPRSTGS